MKALLKVSGTCLLHRSPSLSSCYNVERRLTPLRFRPAFLSRVNGVRFLRKDAGSGEELHRSSPVIFWLHEARLLWHLRHAGPRLVNHASSTVVHYQGTYSQDVGARHLLCSRCNQSSHMRQELCQLLHLQFELRQRQPVAKAIEEPFKIFCARQIEEHLGNGYSCRLKFSFACPHCALLLVLPKLL